jgi:hypothetical protein
MPFGAEPWKYGEAHLKINFTSVKDRSCGLSIFSPEMGSGVDFVLAIHRTTN